MKTVGIYKVEHIVSKKFINGVPFYQIKWEDWDSKYNTWEPVLHLRSCYQLVEMYEKNICDTVQSHLPAFPDKNPPHMLHKTKKIKKNKILKKEPYTPLSKIEFREQNLKLNIFGSLKEKDEVLSVVKAIQKNDNTMFEVSWKKRKKNQFYPCNSVLTEEQAKQHCPLQLIDFYQNYLESTSKQLPIISNIKEKEDNSNDSSSCTIL